MKKVIYKPSCIVKFTPKRGDIVLVRDHEGQEWGERFYLTTIEGASNPFICVDMYKESDFQKGLEFNITSWISMSEKIVIKEKVTLTLEDIAKRFELDVSQLNIIA